MGHIAWCQLDQKIVKINGVAFKLK